MIMSGVPCESLQSETIGKIFSAIGFEHVDFDYKIIGKDNSFILISLKGNWAQRRNEIVKAASFLKPPAGGASESYNSKMRPLVDMELKPEIIYMKKDLPPVVRAEWKRLNDVVRAEKEKPVNQGVNIFLDFKDTRCVYRGEKCPRNVIDKWNCPFK